MNIACAMIVKDEEDHIANCLDSVIGVARQTVVLDTGSTDRTMEIVREYKDAGVRLERSTQFTAETEFIDFHFGNARNEALALVKGSPDWILNIDADETLINDDYTGLENHLFDVPEIEKVIPISVSSGYNEYPSSRVGFYRPDCKWSGRVHETIPMLWIDMKWRINRKVAYIKHWSEYNLDNYNDKYFAHLCRSVHEDRDFGLSCQYLANIFWSKRRWPEVVGYGLAFLAAEDCGPDFYATVSMLVSDAFRNMNKRRAALKWALRACATWPTNSHAHVLTALIYWEAENYQAARFYMSKAKETWAMTENLFAGIEYRLEDIERGIKELETICSGGEAKVPECITVE